MQTSKRRGRHADIQTTPHTNITYGQIEDYLRAAEGNGLKKDTLKTYERNLKRFYQALPQDKQVDASTLSKWRDRLLAEGLHPKTVNVCLSSVNNFLNYLGKWEFQMVQTLESDEIQPEISRNGYFRLLTAARLGGNERTYLLVKMFALTGISLSDLPLVTVEALSGSGIRGRSGGVIRIPGCLRNELLAYAKENNIQKGAVFVTRNGNLMNRSSVHGCIRHLSADARVPEEKANPRCLRKLYFETIAGIKENISILVDQAYDNLLEKEQARIGWQELQE